MNILSYTFEEYVDRARAFHGFAAPGVVLGGFMVALACRDFPEERLFCAISETPKCLPDAIQLLTAKTIGNGRLTVVNLGRYALTLYDISDGVGTRVSLDLARVEASPEIKTWLFKLKPKKEQDYQLLMKEIRDAGPGICRIERVRVSGRFLKKTHRGDMTVCPGCKEAYPAADGAACLGCQGQSPYVASETPDPHGVPSG